MFTNDGIKEGADGYALLQRDLAEAVRDRQLDGDGVRRPLPRVFASAARLNFKISEWRLLRKYSSTARGDVALPALQPEAARHAH